MDPVNAMTQWHDKIKTDPWRRQGSPLGAAGGCFWYAHNLTQKNVVAFPGLKP